MLSSFIIVLREGFEAFLIVAIILAYLRKAGRHGLIGSVYAAIGASVIVSAGLGWVLLQGANQPLWEGLLGLVAVPLIIWLVVHMWRIGPTLRQTMEESLEAKTTGRSSIAAMAGVFLFTLLMVSREGMETALMLFQVESANVLQGALLGLAAAGLMAWAWARYGHRIDLRRFFQVTGIFLIMFTCQIAIYSLHELSEAGLVANQAVVAFHVATEPYASDGRYGRWFTFIMVAVPAVWLFAASVRDRRERSRAGIPSGA